MTAQTLTQPAEGSKPVQSVHVVEAVGKAPTWQAVANRRRDEILQAIPKEYLVAPGLLETANRARLVQSCGLLTERELSIIALSATKLLACIHSRQFTAVEVTKAFCKSASIAHQAVSNHTRTGPQTFSRCVC